MERSSTARPSRPLTLRARFELAACLATGLLFVILGEDPTIKAMFLGVAFACWAIYVLVSITFSPRLVQEWGLGRRGFRPTLRIILPMVLFGTVTLAAAGSARGARIIDPHLPPLMLIYPVCAVIQQLLVQAFVGRHVASATGSWLAAAGTSAVLFAAAHWPDYQLMAACGAMGLLFTPVFLRHRNVIPLGIAHAWLGACFYLWVLGRDPWVWIVTSVTS